MSGYVLRGGDEGAKRLQLLARLKWPTTRRVLHRVGLRRGLRCLDVGCGIGEVTMLMAGWVGSEGRAVGIDANPAYVEMARQQARRLSLNAEFRCGHAADLADEAAFDLVFARFLLCHLPEPARVIERMVRAARPGGIVVGEDLDFSGHFCYPQCHAFQRYVKLFTEAVARNGGDALIGPRLLGLWLDAGLKNVRLHVVQPTFWQGEGKLMAQVTLEHTREKLLAAGLIAAAELDSLLVELDAFARTPRTILSMPRIFQVWGRKPLAV
jgi:SAM-dependent methyltransferase